MGNGNGKDEGGVVPMPGVPGAGQATKIEPNVDYRLVVREIDPDDPTRICKVEYRVHCQGFNVDATGAVRVVKNNVVVAYYAPGEVCSYRKADFNPPEVGRVVVRAEG